METVFLSDSHFQETGDATGDTEYLLTLTYAYKYEQIPYSYYCHCTCDSCYF